MSPFCGLTNPQGIAATAPPDPVVMRTEMGQPGAALRDGHLQGSWPQFIRL